MNEILSAQILIDPQPAARTAVAIAVAAVVSLITLGLLYSGLPFFGPINDLTNAVSGLLTALLAWQFHALLRQRAPALATPVLIAAWIGSALIVANSILVAVGRMHWMTGGMYTALGLAFQGIWLLGMLQLAGLRPYLTPGLMRLGMAAGIGMLFGLLAGPLLVSRVSLASNPLIAVAYAATASGWLLYPLWCWLIGRRLLVQ